MKNKNLLFITWDSPQTSYLESLFMPVFHKIGHKDNIKFHIIQFTWADQEKITKTKKEAERLGINYLTIPILRKPIASLGSLITAKRGTAKIKKYIAENKIDIVMPRSTFPAMMVNAIKNRNFKLIFDADGLPLEERVDFSGLSKDSVQYRKLKSEETKMLKNADAVITRSQKAIEIHLGKIGKEHSNKFFTVPNGKNVEEFNVRAEKRKQIRAELGLGNDLLLVYSGSLGPQYGADEMLVIFENLLEKQPAKFLMLTGNLEFAKSKIPENLKSKIILKTVASSDVPLYLNAADVAFALRKPTFSMQGVAPIKLSEYLLCGVPTIASKGIGDSEEILKNFSNCLLFDHSNTLQQQLPKIIHFIQNRESYNREEIHEKAKQYFSLETAAEKYIQAIRSMK